MQNTLFIFSLATVLGLVYTWAFKHLPRERWQILGTIPIRKQPDGQWQGLNLTYYGFINACAVTFAVMMACILLSAVELPLPVIGLLCFGLLLFCAPGAKWVAYLVEGKKHTFTIGGAAFCGMVVSPLLLMALQPLLLRWGATNLPVLPIIAAMAIAYAFGEGSGRLACLSFGCCYGKPVHMLPLFLQRFAGPFTTVFHGDTKKAAYADGLDGCRIVAVQAITASLYTSIGLLGAYLYLLGHYKSAYLICILGTQIWRILSEFIRADYRGGGRISAYQYLAAIAAVSAVVYSLIIPGGSFGADVVRGLTILWHPVIIIAAQVLWMAIFLYMGRSKITASRISLFVHSDRI
jgi:prolipoprotein diacylglyceryltransferase